MSALSRFAVAASAIAVCLALGAHAAPKDAPRASASAWASAYPKALIDKRIQRVEERAAERARNRSIRANDERRDLRRRLAQRLAGRPLTPPIRAELATHARRVALLRRARLVAAEQNDFESVRKADHALARENARHERWWRTSPDLAPLASPQPSASAAKGSRP